MKIGIFGCAGRMGRMLVNEVLEASGCHLSGGCEVSDHPFMGHDLGIVSGGAKCGLTIVDTSEEIFKESDAVIDFTSPENTEPNITLAKKYSTNLIIGTTGHDTNQKNSIEEASREITMVKAMNFSLGVNVLFALTEQLSSTLKEDFDIEIVEMHHKNKIDAPSGTALGLGEFAAKGRGVLLSDKSYHNWGRNKVRRVGDIGFSSLRGGDVIGEHKVIFAGESEKIEIGHTASSRRLFSKGAIRAAQWSKGKKPGLYDMLDVLGFRDT